MTEQAKPSFLRRLGRAIYRTVRFLLLLIILSTLAVLLVFAAQLGIREINRTVQAINQRIDNQANRTDLLRSDVNDLMATSLDQAGALRNLEHEQQALGRRIDNVDSGLAAGLARQEEMLAALEESLSALAARTSAGEEQMASLGGALAALQGDINQSNEQIDALGGQVDRLAADVAQSTQATGERLEAELAGIREEFATPSEQLAQALLSLRYFRIWEMVARARLRLAENNAGLAANDVALALAAIDDLANSDPGAALALQPVGERLALAAGELPADSATAVADLEQAWAALDQLLGFVLFGSEGSAAATPAPTPTPAASP